MGAIEQRLTRNAPVHARAFFTGEAVDAIVRVITPGFDSKTPAHDGIAFVGGVCAVEVVFAGPAPDDETSSEVFAAGWHARFADWARVLVVTERIELRAGGTEGRGLAPGAAPIGGAAVEPAIEPAIQTCVDAPVFDGPVRDTTFGRDRGVATSVWEAARSRGLSATCRHHRGERNVSKEAHEVGGGRATCWAEERRIVPGIRPPRTPPPLDRLGASPQGCSMSSVDSALIEIERACGSGSVIRDASLLEGYAHDESEADPCMPEAVVRAKSTADVSAVMKAAFAHEVPVTPRGGGTGRVGGAVPVPGGIVLAFEKMNAIEGIDRSELTTRVQPGLITGELQRVTEEEGLFYPPDPNSRDSCAIGGNLAANAGGPRAFKYGVTREYVMGMDVVLADGTILKLGRETKKGVTGYDLTALMVGSEGTLGIVTEATLRLIPKPDATVTALACFSSLDEVAPVVSTLMAQGQLPACIELLDEEAIRIVRPEAGLTIPDETKAMLLIELDGEEAKLESDLERTGNVLFDLDALEVLVAQHSGERERLWASRRELSHSLKRQAANKLSEDVVVPRTKMAELLRYCAELADQHELVIPTYGHAGDGNLHVNFLWDDPEEKARVDASIESLFQRVVELRGTLSGEHGIGVLKAPYLPMEQSPALIALQQKIKDVFDPKHILNPGKIFPADAKRFHGAC